jgi:YgiT-type zinc finger domain-containing protein
MIENVKVGTFTEFTSGGRVNYCIVVSLPVNGTISVRMSEGLYGGITDEIIEVPVDEFVKYHVIVRALPDGYNLFEESSYVKHVASGGIYMIMDAPNSYDYLEEHDETYYRYRSVKVKDSGKRWTRAKSIMEDGRFVSVEFSEFEDTIKRQAPHINLQNHHIAGFNSDVCPMCGLSDTEVKVREETFSWRGKYPVVVKDYTTSECHTCGESFANAESDDKRERSIRALRIIVGEIKE